MASQFEFGLRKREVIKGSPSNPRSLLASDHTTSTEDKSSPKHADMKKTSLSLIVLSCVIACAVIYAISGPISAYDWITGSAGEIHNTSVHMRGRSKSPCYVYFAPSSGKPCIFHQSIIKNFMLMSY